MQALGDLAEAAVSFARVAKLDYEPKSSGPPEGGSVALRRLLALGLLIVGIALAVYGFAPVFYGGVDDPRNELLFVGALGVAFIAAGVILDRMTARTRKR